LLLAIGTTRFHAMSVDIYGGPRSWFDADSTNLDLANHLAQRLEGELASAGPGDQEEKRLDCEAFAKSIRKKSEGIGMSIDVLVDDDISAKVLAGSTRVRVRSGATFRKLEVEGLFVHEVETHALTAQNGAAQPELAFLRSGGPRTTRTQEGLAVFSEFYSHSLLIERMRRIVQRVRLIAAAEDGADFLDLYQRLLETGCTERDAYFDAQRICRGGLVAGRAPFTKDASYLAGFTEVFNFLQVAVRGGAREAVETLACGRIAIDDLAVLVELKRRGVLRPAKYTPRWLDNWDALLPFFAFASFLQEIDLKQVEKRHRELLAASTTPID
ncbi:MAG: tyrosine/phenylalanine carboxypeptidase domain-containing protein, partial [Polyangiales bacterium]